MDTLLGSLATPGTILPLCDPSVLIVESHPKFLESLPRALRSAMPEVMFDVSVSRDDGLSKLETGYYHAVISDARLAEAADYALLKRTQSLSCPVPFLVSQKNGDGQEVSRALAHGALDMIRCSFRGIEASEVIRRALWVYELRLTIYNRRQRMEAFRLRHEASPVTYADQSRLIERTVKKIEEADFLCQRTIEQIASSIRVLEDFCFKVETEARDCALRMAQLL